MAESSLYGDDRRFHLIIYGCYESMVYADGQGLTQTIDGLVSCKSAFRRDHEAAFRGLATRSEEIAFSSGKSGVAI